MPVPTKDCQCEDFPCCEHADNYPVDDNPQLYYCDICGVSHVGDCPDDDPDWADEEDEDDGAYQMLIIGGGREEPHADLQRWD